MLLPDFVQLGAILLGVFSAGFSVGLLMGYYRRFLEQI